MNKLIFLCKLYGFVMWCFVKRDATNKMHPYHFVAQILRAIVSPDMWARLSKNCLVQYPGVQTWMFFGYCSGSRTTWPRISTCVGRGNKYRALDLTYSNNMYCYTRRRRCTPTPQEMILFRSFFPPSWNIFNIVPPCKRLPIIKPTTCLQHMSGPHHNTFHANTGASMRIGAVLEGINVRPSEFIKFSQQAWHAPYPAWQKTSTMFDVLSLDVLLS